MTPTSSSSPSPLAVVTGAGSGIGRALAVQLATLGYDLMLVDIDPAGLEATSQQAVPLEVAVQIHVGDIASDTTWHSLVERLEGRAVSLLVNNAGTLLVGDVALCDPVALRRVVDVNLTGALLGCHALVPCLSDEPPAPLPAGVLHIASIFATLAPPGFAAYNASKAGLVALSESLRQELLPRGLRSVVVLPGVVPTKLFDRGDYGDDRLREVVAHYVEKAELSPVQVASEALLALRRGRPEQPIGRRATWFYRAKRWLPVWLLDRLTRSATRQVASAQTSKNR